MEEKKLNPMECASRDDVIYFGAGIMRLFGFEEGIICGLIDSEGIEGLLDGKFLKSFKKSKIKRAVEKLLCCGILEIENGFLSWNRDRYLELNSLGVKVENETYSKYTGCGTEEDLLKYEEMVNFVNDIFRNLNLN